MKPLIALALAAAALYAFLRRRQTEFPCPRYFEPEDGIQPPDPRPLELTYSVTHIPRTIGYPAYQPNVPYWTTASCGLAHPWGICPGHAR